MSSPGRRAAPSLSLDDSDISSIGPIEIPDAVRDEVTRQFLRMGYTRRIGMLAVAMMASAQEEALAQLERGLASLDACAARRPELAGSLERQRAALVDNALALADLSRERIIQIALHLPAEMADPTYWDRDPSWWRRFKHEIVAELLSRERGRERHRPTDEFAIGLTAGLWRPSRNQRR